jgi:hypothetical protein
MPIDVRAGAVSHCFVLVTAAVTASCASNVEVGYPAPVAVSQTGIVLVRFTEPMRSVSVSVDGILVAEDRHTERVQITNVPLGAREVVVVASEGSRSETVHHTERVTVDATNPALILVATPPRSLGYWISTAAAWLTYGILLLTMDDELR